MLLKLCESKLSSQEKHYELLLKVIRLHSAHFFYTWGCIVYSDLKIAPQHKNWIQWKFWCDDFLPDSTWIIKRCYNHLNRGHRLLTSLSREGYAKPIFTSESIDGVQNLIMLCRHVTYSKFGVTLDIYCTMNLPCKRPFLGGPHIVWQNLKKIFESIGASNFLKRLNGSDSRVAHKILAGEE